MNSESLSVVIPTVYRRESLHRCLRSIAVQTVRPNEVIIASAKQLDSNAIEELSSIVETNGTRFVFVHTDSGNVHLDKKTGFEASTGSIVCFLDDDVVLEDDFLERVLEAFEKLSADAIQPLVESPKTDKGIKLLFKRLSLMNTDKGEGKIMKSGFPSMPFNLEQVKEIEILMGSTCFRRSVFEKRDYFDPEIAITMNWADVFFSRSISQDGFRFFYYPDAKMKHLHEPGGRRAINSYIAGYRFNHWLLWSRYVKKDFASTFAYYWSTIWIYIIFLFKSVRSKNIRKTLMGLKQGGAWIKRYRRDCTFPSMCEIEFED